jgi:hypothetical protein
LNYNFTFQDTSHVDISFEAKVELKHAAVEITRLEEELFGKQAAIDNLSQENDKLREQLSNQVLVQDQIGIHVFEPGIICTCFGHQ